MRASARRATSYHDCSESHSVRKGPCPSPAAGCAGGGRVSSRPQSCPCQSVGQRENLRFPGRPGNSREAFRAGGAERRRRSEGPEITEMRVGGTAPRTLLHQPPRIIRRRPVRAFGVTNTFTPSRSHHHSSPNKRADFGDGRADLRLGGVATSGSGFAADRFADPIPPPFAAFGFAGFTDPFRFVSTSSVGD